MLLSIQFAPTWVQDEGRIRSVYKGRPYDDRIRSLPTACYSELPSTQRHNDYNIIVVTGIREQRGKFD